MSKGIIALDIDGTLTTGLFLLPEPVQLFLEELQHSGWTLIFITGRPFGWGSRPLRSLKVPYYVASINGAELIQMPEIELIHREPIALGDIDAMEPICNGEDTDYILYGGFIAQDRCFYRPKRFSQQLFEYLKRRCAYLQEEWIAVDNFVELPVKSFSSLKCFGSEESCSRIVKRIETTLNWRATAIRDPFDNTICVAQVTNAHCDKGEALLAFSRRIECQGPIIAAGDDFNDASMLRVANIAIAMETAPMAVQALADIIAPSAAKCGIIIALQVAIKNAQSHGS